MQSRLNFYNQICRTKSWPLDWHHGSNQFQLLVSGLVNNWSMLFFSWKSNVCNFLSPDHRERCKYICIFSLDILYILSILFATKKSIRRIDVGSFSMGTDFCSFNVNSHQRCESSIRWGKQCWTKYWKRWAKKSQIW